MYIILEKHSTWLLIDEGIVFFTFDVRLLHRIAQCNRDISCLISAEDVLLKSMSSTKNSYEITL